MGLYTRKYSLSIRGSENKNSNGAGSEHKFPTADASPPSAKPETRLPRKRIRNRYVLRESKINNFPVEKSGDFLYNGEKKLKLVGEYMDGVNKTLYIPLYGKAYVSAKGCFLSDRKAEEIWAAEGFPLKGKSKSKWLAYYMGIRSAVFDEWLGQRMRDLQDAVVVQIGCGMDSRVIRIGTDNHKWYDVDFAEVITERRRYYSESEHYQMIAGDARDCSWLTAVKENKSAILVMEGVSMYLTVEEMRNLMSSLSAHFESISLLADCYTSFAARMSKYRNPINDVGVTQVYGIDDPYSYQRDKFTFVKEHTMIPQKYIDELKGFERFVFARLYAGSFSKKLYRLLEYAKN